MKKQMPDVAYDPKLKLKLPLAQVGMTGIESFVQFKGYKQSARVNAFVSLDDANARGIHMSRLFMLVQKHLTTAELSFGLLTEIIQQFLITHKDLSQNAEIEVTHDLVIERKALKSDNSAYRTYPVSWKVKSNHGVLEKSLKVQVIYSSTCPASAALSRQLLQEDFLKQFANSNLNLDEISNWLSQNHHATPHNQRSVATVEVVVKEDSYSPMELINTIEAALQTPVQAAVKREDEQEFARLNGQNSMFCEDAARKVKSVLLQDPRIHHAAGEMNHIESLHPHNAVARF